MEVNKHVVYTGTLTHHYLLHGKLLISQAARKIPEQIYFCSPLRSCLLE